MEGSAAGLVTGVALSAKELAVVARFGSIAVETSTTIPAGSVTHLEAWTQLLDVGAVPLAGRASSQAEKVRY